MNSISIRSFLVALAAVLAWGSALARGPIELPYLAPASKVLGLYDSGEGGHGVNVVLKKRVARALKRLGLPLVLHDVRKGLPDAPTMTAYRAVITAFDDASMAHAKAYSRWLGDQITAGRRVVVLNSFGAFKDSTTNKFLGWADINHVFKKLGVVYDAQWTADPRQLVVRSHDSSVMARVPDPRDARHYYRFKVVGPDVRAHLVVERTDIRDGQSAVVMTSNTGGMALTRWYENSAFKQNIRLEAFLDKALFPQRHRSQRVLFVVDPESATGHRAEINLYWVVKYARLQADFVRLGDFPRLRRRDLRAYGSVVMASDSSAMLYSGRTLTDLERWVHEDGGGFVSFFAMRRPEWDKMLGIAKWSEKTRTVPAMRYLDDFFPGLRGLVATGDSYSARLYTPRLAKDVKVHAVGADPKRPGWVGPPVLWSRRHGEGRVLYRADSALTQKEWRGSMLQMVLQSMPVAAAPIVNARVYYVDDCPQPMWNVVKDPIKKEMNLSDTDFYRSVWWPDLMKLANDFKQKLTFVLIFSYDNKVKEAPGFTAEPFYADQGKGVPAWMAREAVRLGHEVGLHGYNHQSLVYHKGYTSAGWQSRDAMVESLKLARVEWEKLFGPGQVPFTYIAPNNHIHRAGKEAVRIVFPEIRVMSAQYLNENDIEGQEFDSDPDVEHFMGIPRVSSEWYTGSHNNVSMHDAVALLGIWSHFVHPDDVYDPERNGNLNWAGLNKAAREMLSHMTTSYPWLRSMTAREAYHELVRFRSSAFHYEVGENEVQVHLSTGDNRPTQFVLRVDPSIAVMSVDNGKILHGYPALGYYYLEGMGPVARVQIKR